MHSEPAASLYLRPLAFVLAAAAAMFGLLCTASTHNDTSYEVAALAVSILTFMVISVYLILSRPINIFAPFEVFSIYYYTIPLTAVYFWYTDFSSSLVVLNVSFNERIDALFLWSMIYYLAGYLAAMAGYLAVRQRRRWSVSFKSHYLLSDGLLNAVIVTFLAVGLGNFALNVIVVAGGNVLTYVTSFAAMGHEFKGTGLTAVGYQFAYVAMYVWLYKICRRHSKMPLLFVLIFVFTLMIRFSTGRITSTLVYVSSFFIIQYYLSSADIRRLNRKYLIGVGVFMFVGVCIYFLRIFSALQYQGLELNLGAVLSPERIFYFAFDRGNTPHIPIFMKIIDAWGTDVGYLYGRTLVSWVLSLVPSGILDPHDYLISLQIKRTWLDHMVSGGGQPPTGVGEMYANFGVLGPFLGMMLFGSFCGVVNNLVVLSRSFWVLAIYSQVAIGFFMIYAKGDFANLSPWFIAPLAVTYGILRLLAFAATAEVRWRPASRAAG